MAMFTNSPHTRVVDPTTPVHSPHHSVHSSASSRLSLRNLTLHEYRKQQNSPASQATPPGKTLRRKAAASGLKEIERVPSLSRTPLSAARVPPRPLHISQSTHSLYTYQQLPPSPPHQEHDLTADEIFRSQSAEPSIQHNSFEKLRKFKPIKRLPKPLSSGRGSLPISPAPLAPVTSNQPRLSPLRTASIPSVQDPTLNASQSTPSSFSLSRFPRPPDLVNTPLSPFSNDDDTPRVNTISFTSTAPATPPATPAVIHYRGASFDLVNPHNSLVLDNIVTPSRDLDSSDYLPLRTSEDPLDFPEMAPKRALYGDLSSAYAHIITRNGDELPGSLALNMPLPPTPVAQSPGSLSFDSPMQSPELPQAERRPATESRFSLKQLTRSLTNRFSKAPEKPHEEELHEFSDSHVSLASASFVGEFPRPLERSYQPLTPKSATFSDEPHTPVSPLDQAVQLMSQRSSPPSVERSRYLAQRVVSAPLSSMIPDSPSIELGRAEVEHPYLSDASLSTRPYYDDLASLYPSSSIYTSGSRRQSGCMQSRSSNRKSNRYSMRANEDVDALADEYKSDFSPLHMNSHRTSRHVSYPLGQALLHRSLQPESDKTDTISKFIDHYKSVNGRNSSLPLFNGAIGEATGAMDSSSDVSSIAEPAEQLENHFEFDSYHSKLETKEIPDLKSGAAGLGRLLAPPPGNPPSTMAPLAPAFEYDEAFDSPKQSDLSSKVASYGDTRQLLQISSQCIAYNSDPTQPTLKSSSSYSQPGISSDLRTSRNLMEQEAAKIPAIWMKRVSSQNLLRSKSKGNPQQAFQEDDLSDLANYEDEVDLADLADWETVGNGSPRRYVRDSLGESLADYSSSDGTHSSRDSMGFSGSFPVYEGLTQENSTTQYRHPGSLHNHSNPFTSSPPRLSAGATMPVMVPDHQENLLSSSPPASSTVPAFYGRGHDMDNCPGSPQQERFPWVPWTNPYSFSEKETQELLASGPNEEILYDNEKGADIHHSYVSQEVSSPVQPPKSAFPTGTTMDSEFGAPDSRENSFSKLTVVGPKGNLTGTPHGTGMHDAGSSVADNSSPGAILDSSPLVSPVGRPTGYHVFKSAATRNASVNPEAADYFGVHATSNARSNAPGLQEASDRMGFVNRITPTISTPSVKQEASPSRALILPQEPASTDPGRRAKRLSLRSPIPVTPRDSRRRGSRAAVPGQTKLRQMVLAPSAQTLSSSDLSVNDSGAHSSPDSARPSTSNTHTPLRAHASRPTLQKVFANEHSPHLLCPERLIDPEFEAERRHVSWVIFTLFCALPPALILYRWMGDMVIVNVTKGRFTRVDPKPKQIALGAGIAVNISIVAGILLPILIAHATGTL